AARAEPCFRRSQGRRSRSRNVARASRSPSRDSFGQVVDGANDERVVQLIADALRRAFARTREGLLDEFDAQAVARREAGAIQFAFGVADQALRLGVR